MCEENGWKFCGKFCDFFKVMRLARDVAEKKGLESIAFDHIATDRCGKNQYFSPLRENRDEMKSWRKPSKTTHNSLHFTNSRKRWRCGDEVQHFSTRAQTQVCKMMGGMGVLEFNIMPVVVDGRRKNDSTLCIFKELSPLLRRRCSALIFFFISPCSVSRLLLFVAPPYLPPARTFHFFFFLMLLETTTKQPNDLVHPLMPLPHSLRVYSASPEEWKFFVSPQLFLSLTLQLSLFAHHHTTSYIHNHTPENFVQFSRIFLTNTHKKL